jgi:cytochrome c oxidase subunit II
MIFFVVRYRRDRHPQASDIRGNWLAELTWMAVPTLIALSMFYFGWESFLGLRTVPPDAITIDVQAMQFSWVFIYPNQKQSSGDLVVPQGKPIKLNLTSLDVIHGFYVPAFRIKMDAIKNMKTYTWFYADRIGEYPIFCTQYCGVGHADMRGTVRIVSKAEYDEWLNKK